MLKNPPIISSPPPVFKDLPQDEKNYNIWIFLSGENLKIFVNDHIVLSSRVYNFKKGKAGIYVIEDKIKLKKFNFAGNL